MESSVKKSTLSISENGIEKKISEKRLEVLKTYKIYIGVNFQEQNLADTINLKMP